MGEATAWLIALAALLTVLIVVGYRLGGAARYILYLQAAYWASAYLARPLVLLIGQPTPRPNDSIADRRLAVDDYATGIASVLPIVVVGLAAYVLVLILLQRSIYHRPFVERATAANGVKFDLRFVAFLYATGWACRIAVSYSLTNPVTVSLSSAASLAIGLAFLRVDWTGISRLSQVIFLGILATGELIYSGVSESKTPLMGVILFLAIAYGGKIKSLRTALSALGVLLIALVGFTSVQALKLSGRTSDEIDLVAGGYPPLIGPLLPILRRFDLLSSATDAYFVGPGRWLTLGEYGERLVYGFVPHILSSEPYQSAGVAWAQEVRSATVPQTADVSLADGFIAEGYAMAGYLGVALEASVLGLATLLIARSLSSTNALKVFTGVGILSYPVLFERGLLGLSENLGQTLQVAIAAYLAVLLLPAASRNGDASDDISDHLAYRRQRP